MRRISCTAHYCNEIGTVPSVYYVANDTRLIAPYEIAVWAVDELLSSASLKNEMESIRCNYKTVELDARGWGRENSCHNLHHQPEKRRNDLDNNNKLLPRAVKQLSISSFSRCYEYIQSNRSALRLQCSINVCSMHSGMKMKADKRTEHNVWVCILFLLSLAMRCPVKREGTEDAHRHKCILHCKQKRPPTFLDYYSSIVKMRSTQHMPNAK